ncbi:MAG: UPF0149 family protein [Methylococcaceae bacterium]|nr:UPF0149 family protein [Methylococcaceae bacterium]
MLPHSLTNKLTTLFTQLDLGEECFNVAETDGFIYAIAITPETIPPKEWIPTIFDNKIPKLNSPEEGDKIMGTLMECYQSYHKKQSNDTLTFDVDLNQINSQTFNELIDWSWGFLTALNLRMSFWTEKSDFKTKDLEENPVRNSLGVLKALVYRDYDAIPEIKQIVEKYKEESEEKLKTRILIELIAALPQAIKIIQEYAKYGINSKRPKVTQPITSNKKGRNEPCPCGSGKKYKKCCMLKKDGQYLH